MITAPTCTEQGYTTHTCACGESYMDSYVDALGHDCSAGVCAVCGHDSVNAVVKNGTLTVTCDEMEPDTIIWLVAYNGDGRFAAMKRVTLGEALTLPAGERYVLFFVNDNWTPLRKELEL